MTNDHDEPECSALELSILRREPTPAEIEVLELIAAPLDAQVQNEWPLWDFVSRSAGRGSDAELDADAVLAGMPTAARRSSFPGNPYGWVWRSEIGTTSPRTGEQVGLTIAGLMALSRTRPLANTFADQLAVLIWHIAHLERNIKPDRHSVADPNVPLGDLGTWFKVSREFRAQISDSVVMQTLQKEYDPISISLGGDGPFVRTTEALRKYRLVFDADSYLTVVEQRIIPPVAMARFSATDLPLMLDYVSHVLSAHPKWGVGSLTRHSELSPAISLGLSAYSEAEARTRIADLAVVLGGLNVPDIDPEELPKDLRKHQLKPLKKLQFWLAHNIDDAEAKHRAVEAVSSLRGVIDIRNWLQHPSASLHVRARAALNHFGIADPVLDWPQAWDVIRARTAEALDDVRRELSA